MEKFINIVSVPVIATIVYWVINLIKYTVNNSEKFKRLIPIVSAVIGACLGIVAFYVVPGVVPADNMLMATVIGGASGLTATGTNQVLKQLNKGKDYEDENERKG